MTYSPKVSLFNKLGMRLKNVSCWPKPVFFLGFFLLRSFSIWGSCRNDIFFYIHHIFKGAVSQNFSWIHTLTIKLQLQLAAVSVYSGVLLPTVCFEHEFDTRSILTYCIFNTWRVSSVPDWLLYFGDPGAAVAHQVEHAYLRWERCAQWPPSSLELVPANRW